MNIKIFYSVIILLESCFFLLIGCDNWKDVPTHCAVEIDSIRINESVFWQKIDVPENISYFHPYLKDWLLAGTKKGEIFYSSDNGKSWNKSTFNVEKPGAVQAVVHRYVVNRNYFGIGPKGNFYTCAVTDSGIFSSSNEGRSWTLDAKFSADQLPASIYSISDDKNYGYITVFMSGKFGKLNTYSTLNSYSSRKWRTLDIGQGIIKLFEYPYLYLIDSSANYLASYDGSNSKYSYSIKSGNEVNSLAANSKGIGFAATKTGIIVTRNSGISWSVVSFNNTEVKKIAVSSTDILYIYKSDGIFCSLDDGLSWTDVSPPFNASVEDLKISTDGIVYIKTGNLEYHYIPIDSKKILYIPILLFPANNEIVESSSLKLNWYEWKNVACRYNMQISEDSSFTKQLLVNERWLNTNSYAVNGLLKNKKYYWRVSAINSISQSQWSEASAFILK